MAARIMITVITIISSSSVNPRSGEREKGRRGDREKKAFTPLLPFSRSPLLFRTLPVTIFLSVERSVFGFRPHIEDVFTAPRARIRRVVAGSHIPFRLSCHRIDWNRAEIDLLLCRQFAPANVSSIYTLHTGPRRTTPARYNIHTADKRFEVRRITIRVVDSEYRGIANYDSAARIRLHVWLRWLRLPKRNSD